MLIVTCISLLVPKLCYSKCNDLGGGRENTHQKARSSAIYSFLSNNLIHFCKNLLYFVHLPLISIYLGKYLYGIDPYIEMSEARQILKHFFYQKRSHGFSSLM